MDVVRVISASTSAAGVQQLLRAVAILRVVTAALFMAHAITRIVVGSIPAFAQFLASKGFPAAVVLVWLISITEIVSGTCLIANRLVRWAAAALALIAFMGIVLIHASLGWFVGEFGTGGMEYSVSLLASLLVVAAADGARNKTSSRPLASQ